MTEALTAAMGPMADIVLDSIYATLLHAAMMPYSLHLHDGSTTNERKLNLFMGDPKHSVRARFFQRQCGDAGWPYHGRPLGPQQWVQTDPSVRTAKQTVLLAGGVTQPLIWPGSRDNPEHCLAASRNPKQRSRRRPFIGVKIIIQLLIGRELQEPYDARCDSDDVRGRRSSSVDGSDGVGVAFQIPFNGADHGRPGGD